MKRLKYIFLFLLTLSFLTLSACGKDNVPDDQSTVEIKPCDTQNLINYYQKLSYLENLGLAKISDDYYNAFYCDKLLVDNPVFISNEKKLNELDLNIDSKYDSSYFRSKSLLLVPYKKSGTTDVSLLSINKSDAECNVVLSNLNGSPVDKTFIIEFDYDYPTQLVNKMFDIKIDTINIDNVDNINSKLKQVLIKKDYYDITINNTNYSLIEMEKVDIINNELSSLIFTEVNKENFNSPIITLTSTNLVLSIYDFNYFELTQGSSTIYCKRNNGDFSFIYSMLLNSNDSNSKLINNLVNALHYSYKNNVLSLKHENEVLSFINKLVSWEAPNDMIDLDFISSLEFIQGNCEILNSEEINSLKEYISILKKIDTDFDINYAILIVSEANSSLYNAKRNEEVELAPSLIDGSLFLGYFDKLGNMYSSFKYNYYSDLFLNAKYVSSTDYDLETIELKDDNGNDINVVSIKKYNGSDSDIFLPLYDENGKKIESISEGAFKDNSNIKSVNFNSFIKYIGNNAFDGCANLESIILTPNILRLGTNVFSNCLKITNVDLNEGLESLGTYTFTNCMSLKEIYIPSSIVDLGEHLFDGCDSLESLTVSKNNPKFYSSNNCIMEETTLYYGCKTSTVPDGCVFIREYAFYKCNGLTSIYIPSSVVHVDQGAFRDCINLKEVYISKSVMYIANYSFTTGTNTVINCEYNQKMSGWTKNWTTGETIVNWDIPQPQNN